MAHPGEAILFRYGESTCYGVPDSRSLPYENEWVCMSGADEIFLGLIEQRGRKVSMPEGSLATRLLREIIDCYQNRAFVDRFHESSLAYQLLMACCRVPDSLPRSEDVALRSREYILSNYQSPFTQEDLAEFVGVCREHLSRRFRETYGVSPGRFCAGLRMARAKNLLHLSPAPIAEIALLCGYADANSFSRAFRQYYGMSPRQMKDAAMRDVTE